MIVCENFNQTAFLSTYLQNKNLKSKSTLIVSYFIFFCGISSSEALPLTLFMHKSIYSQISDHLGVILTIPNGHFNTTQINVH